MRITINTRTVVVVCGAVLVLLFTYGLGVEAGRHSTMVDLESMQSRIMEGISDVADTMSSSSETSLQVIASEELRCAESKERWAANRGSSIGMQLLEESCAMIINTTDLLLSHQELMLLQLEIIALEVEDAVQETEGL